MFDENCRTEVVGMHQFIEGWLTGQVPKAKNIFLRFRDVLAENFELISPRGVRLSKDPLCDEFWGAHGIRPLEFHIEIHQLSSTSLADGVALLTYEEWQREGASAPPTVRVSSAVFQPRVGLPNEVEWRYLHETWRPAE